MDANQAVFVIGGMLTLPSLLVHEGDASFLVGHPFFTSVVSPWCCSAFFLVKVPLCEQQTFTSKLAVTQACYLLSALFCTTALISEGCTLAGSVLQCSVAGYSAFV